MSRREVFRGRILDLNVETHELPDGRRADFEIIRHPGGAAVLPFLADGRVLLIRQFRAAVGGMILEIPAGRLEPGEPPEACVRRELIEEAGYRAGRLAPLGRIHPTVGFCDEVIFLFAATDLVAVPRAPEADEFIEPVPMSFAAALAAVADGTITDAKTQLALLRYRLLQE